MKLRTAGLDDDAQKLEDCHSRFIIQLCTGCSVVKKFPNRCDNFFCPECQPTLSRARAKSVEWWTIGLSQPKHVVLTVRNIPDLTRGHVKQLKRWFRNLRTRKFARGWHGGFYNIECTNEGRGWHLHIHALIQARYIDKFQLSEQWSQITGKMGRIVDVRDCRKADYLKEVTKYTVKGSQLAAWSPDKIAAFVTAFKGVRTFGVFGELYGKRTEYAEWLAANATKATRCPCGCDEFKYYDEHEWLMKDLVPFESLPTRPPPQQPDPQIQFDLR